MALELVLLMFQDFVWGIYTLLVGAGFAFGAAVCFVDWLLWRFEEQQPLD